MAYERTIAPPLILPHCGSCRISPANQLLHRFPKRSVNSWLLYIRNLILTRLLLVLFLSFVDNGVVAQPDAPAGGSTFNSPGLFTWTCPAGITCIKVECWGGGGRGGNQTGAGASGGGGGGAYSRGSSLTVIPGNTYYINVGNGSTTTLPGGDSWFGPTSQPADAVAMAKGGNSVADNGAGGATGGSAAGCIGDKKYNGGNGGNSVSGNSGGGGGGAGTTGAGGNANGVTAGTGTPLYGGSGGAGLTVDGNGFSGSTYGGGGGGEKRSATDFLPGNGASGLIMVTYLSVYQVTPINGSYCEGAMVTIGLSGSETGARYQLLRNAVPTGTPVSGTGNPVSFGNQFLLGTYTVTASLDSSTCTRLMTGSVVIHPDPVITISGPTPVCTGSTGNVYTTQAGMTNYTWAVSPGGTVTAGGTPTDNTITITWNTAGFRTVSVNYTNSNGCAADSPTVYTVSVLQQSADPTSAIASPSAICNGQSSTLILIGGGGGGTGSSIHWYSGSCGGTPVGIGNNLVVSPSVTTTYYGRYEDPPPCSYSACAQVTVTVSQKSGNPTSATASPATICSGQTSTLTLTGGGGGTGTVIHWYTGSCGGTSVGTGNGLVVSPIATTTYYGRYEDPAPCSFNTTCAQVTVTVSQSSGNPTSAIASPSVICIGQSSTLILIGGGGGTGTVIRWYSGSCGGTLVGTGNNLVVSPVVTTTYFGRYEDPAPCSYHTACAQVTVTVNQLSGNPASATASPASICAGQTAALTLSGGGGGTGEVIRWYTGSCGSTLVGSGNGLVVSPAVTTTYYGRYEDPAPCNFNTGCAQVTVTVNPNPSVNLSASPETICLNGSTTLTANSSGGTVSTSFSGSSGNINVQIPESRVNWAGSNIALSGGGSATLEMTDIITVTLNITHTSNDQLDIFLVDPSGNRCMLLSSDNGGNGDNYLNAILQTGATPNVNILAGVNTTITGTYGTEGALNTLAPLVGGNGGNYAPAAVPQSILLGAPIDGNWSIRVFDDDNLGSLGTLVNWSISITRPIGFYTCVFNGPGIIGPVTYSGPYNSIAKANVTPPVGTNSYTVTTSDAFGCSVTSTPVIVTVNALPDATIMAKYCAVPGYIRLIAHPMPPGYSYLWNTGATTDSIDVDVAGVYWVKVTDLTTTCSATAYLTTATELVTDGTFTNFIPASPTFFTEYTQNQNFYTGVPTSGLWPEGYYAVNLSAWSNWPNPPQGYHPNFHGRDHTNNTVGPRNFMMINGSKELIGSPPHERVIWQQTVPVWPNTDYYFSAWGMNLNPASPAKLRFEVNGVQVGTIADLNLAPKPTSEGEVNLANYIRFYSNPTWNSGTATTAVIRIINLNLIAGGNDFGLDDISFGTLAPIPYDFDPEANGGGPVCLGGILSLSANVEGGIGPFSYLWTGPDGWTSTLPDPSRSPVTMAMDGIYGVLVSDLGTNCPGFTSTVLVTVHPAADPSITGAGSVCPVSAGNIYSAAAGMSSYDWIITGNGTITGPLDESSVSVTAGPICDSSFTLTLTVINEYGCDSTGSKTVSVNDTIPPAINCPNDTTLMADAGYTYATLILEPPVFSDNCAAADSLEIYWIMTGATDSTGVGFIPVPFRFNIDTTHVSYFIADQCANSNSCYFTVIVLPNDPPEISCPDTLFSATDEGLCIATSSPGFPTLISGTPPIDYTWEMTGATIDSGTDSITPDPYTFNEGVTIITWIASNIAGKDTCQQVVVVMDDEPPDFDTPDPFVFCVQDIDTAAWNHLPEPETDIEPDRPDYYLVGPGDTVLDLDAATFQDNCCDLDEPDEFEVYWRIDFSDGTSLPPLPGAYITGQPSEYGPGIILPGDGVLFNNLVHTITYRLADCHGNISGPSPPVTITIKPRPNIIKL